MPINVLFQIMLGRMVVLSPYQNGLSFQQCLAEPPTSAEAVFADIERS